MHAEAVEFAELIAISRLTDILGSGGFRFECGSLHGSSVDVKLGEEVFKRWVGSCKNLDMFLRFWVSVLEKSWEDDGVQHLLRVIISEDVGQWDSLVEGMGVH